MIVVEKIVRAKRYLVRTIQAIELEAKRLFARESMGYCPRCDGCGIDECCPAERCDNGPLCPKFYGTSAERHELIGERKGWNRCWEWLHKNPCDCIECMARKRPTLP